MFDWALFGLHRAALFAVDWDKCSRVVGVVAVVGGGGGWS